MVKDERKMGGTDFTGLRVVVVGAGRSGLGAALLLERSGARVTVNDRAAAEGAEVEDLRSRGVAFVFGDHPRGIFEETDLVVLSPGVPLSALPLGGLNVPVVGELELAAGFTDAPVVAVTGTNGKSTVTHLIHAMAVAGGKDALRCGNVGDAVSRVLWERGAGGSGAWRQPDLAVIEVSSFQLETIRRFRPAVAVVLNLSPDHMDRYASLDAYRLAKERIFMNQTPGDVAVLNRDDPAVASMASSTRARSWWFSRQGQVNNGVWADGEGIIRWASPDGPAVICRTDEIGIRGVHNLENALAASAAALAAGVNPAAVAGTLREFRGLPHRMEFVGEHNGVAYVNDSKGTNVGAVLRSLESMDTPVLLIAGGRDKDGDFSLLEDLVREKVAHLILIGEAAEKIGRALGRAAASVHTAGTLGAAVRYAAERGRPGDTVLLSPGCASFDQFKDFEDRGRRFRGFVEELGDA